MITRTIGKEDAGAHLLKYLMRLLPGAPKSFLYKALRQNKIKVNRQKPADLSQALQEGDVLSLYLSPEQEKDFLPPASSLSRSVMTRPEKEVDNGKWQAPEVVYEDENLLIVNKAAGVLSQKSRKEDVSMTEICRHYLQQKKSRAEKEAGSVYQPSFVQRLDRNTTGLMMMAKTLASSQALSQMIRERWLDKRYLAVVEGDASRYDQPVLMEHGYRKDEKNNKAQLVHLSGKEERRGLPEGYQLCQIRVRFLGKGVFHGQNRQSSENIPQTISLLEVELVTGKSHQIRAQLSFEGFPIVGDGKYNKRAEGTYRQLLTASRLTFTKCVEPLAYLTGRSFTARVTGDMRNILSEAGLERTLDHYLGR